MTNSVTRINDVIDSILKLDAQNSIHRVRDQFPENRSDLQAYYDAIFRPTVSSAQAFPLDWRFLLAIRTASHTNSTSVADWYTSAAKTLDVPEQLIEIASTPGKSGTGISALDAALRHADLLVSRPVDASRADIEALETAGINSSGIVSLSQVVAFVSYQLRFVALIRAVGELS